MNLKNVGPTFFQDNLNLYEIIIINGFMVEIIIVGYVNPILSIKDSCFENIIIEL